MTIPVKNGYPVSGTAFLAILGGALLGCAHPPFRTGMLAAAGFVPLFFLLADAGTYGSVFRRSYATFFVFNLVTLYWPGGFVHGRDGYLMVSGILLLLAHPLFMTLPMLAWQAVRRGAGPGPAVLAFPFLWVTFEYLHSSTQLSFPWLTLGNTQTYDPAVVQVASITGVYGISFWLLWLNVLLHRLFVTVARGPGRRRRGGAALLVAAIVVVYSAPIIAAKWIDPGEPSAGDGLDVTVIQPNIDPFEKWETAGPSQMRTLMALTGSALAEGRSDLVIWPETAVPYYILSPASAAEFRELRWFVDSIGVPLLTGIPDIVVHGAGPAPAGSKTFPDGTKYETFNSSLLLLPGVDAIQKYAKTLLVPFAERVPYSEVLGFLNAAQWNFGLGGWSIGRDTVLPRFPAPGGDTVSFGNLICYESVYPAYVAGLVRRGARFLTVITNDSWWGNTSGVYQHRQFAVLRAVENRRWIVQCANGGISFAVDPSGRIHSETALFARAAFRQTIGTPDEVTFYTRHGDWLAESSAIVALFIVFASWLQGRRRKESERT